MPILPVQENKPMTQRNSTLIIKITRDLPHPCNKLQRL